MSTNRSCTVSTPGTNSKGIVMGDNTTSSGNTTSNGSTPSCYDDDSASWSVVGGSNSSSNSSSGGGGNTSNSGNHCHHNRNTPNGKLKRASSLSTRGGATNTNTANTVATTKTANTNKDTNTTMKNSLSHSQQQQLPPPAIPPKRTFSNNNNNNNHTKSTSMSASTKIRRAQSGTVMSLQQQQQMSNTKQKQQHHPPLRSQSFSVANGTGGRHNNNNSNSNSNSNNNNTNNGSRQQATNKNKALPIRSTSYNHNTNGGNQNKANHNKPTSTRQLLSLDKVELFNITTTTTSSTEPPQKIILRRSADFLLSYRLQYLDAPTSTSTSTSSSMDTAFTPHNRCDYRLINNDDRILKIQQEQSLYYNFKPLIVNNETRFVPKAIQRQTNPALVKNTSHHQNRTGNNINHDNNTTTTTTTTTATTNVENYSETIAIITSIYNKLSWTNLHKLTLKFIEALGTNSTTGSSGSSNTTVTTNTTSNNHTPDTAANATVVADESRNSNNNINNNSNNNSQLQIIVPELIDITMKIIVDKAMREIHFAELYAHFVYQLSLIHVKFKRTILRICQEQFEAYATVATTTTTTKGNGSTTSTSSSSNTKKIIGLMKFIGELYVKGLIKTSIMIACCERLLSLPESSAPSSGDDSGDSHVVAATTITNSEYEDKLECFCQLMTTIGQRLEQQATMETAAAPTNSDRKETAYTKLWDHVYSLSGQTPPRRPTLPLDDAAVDNNNVNTSTTPTLQRQSGLIISTRIKFLLQSLVELKENNWIQIRHVHEKPQTLTEIHKKIKEEMKLGPITRTTSSTLLLKRSQSNDNMLFDLHEDNSSEYHHYAGNVVGTATPGSECNINNVATTIVGSNQHRQQQRQSKSRLRRTKSDAVMGTVSTANDYSTSSNFSDLSSLQQQKATTLISPPHASVSAKKTSSKQHKHLDPAQVGDRTRAILKEYFVSGDRSEAVLLIAEMINIHSTGHIERGKAVLLSGIFLVLEMKEVNVRKFLDVISKCLDDQKIDKACFIPALMEPLELIRDIEIDAPLAPKLLAIVIADWLTKKVDDGKTPIDSLEFILNSPENFLKDGDSAKFAAQVVKERVGEISTSDIQLIEMLMKKEDLNLYANGEAFLKSFN